MAVTMAATNTGPGSSAPRKTLAIAGGGLISYPFSITFDSSYPTGGESIAASVDPDSPYSVMRTIIGITFFPVIAPGGTGGENAGDILEGVLDPTNKKVLVFTTPATPGNRVEITSTHNLSLITMYGVAYGLR